MSRFNLRKRARVCYYEPEEPPFDEFVFCSECQDYVYEYCSIHGPLLVIPDDQVPAETGFPAFVPRAALSIPRMFLHIAYSYIPEAGLGVFSTLTLPAGVRFGPYRGQRVKSAGDSSYGWQIYDRNHKPLHIVDARDANNSNWMRYVNCARHHTEQNLVAFQYQGELYYRTVKVVPRFTELLVFYGSEFADGLGVDLRAYNKPCPCPACQARLADKNEPAKTNKRQVRVPGKKEKQTIETGKRSPVEKLQEPSPSPQVESSLNLDIQEVPPEKPPVNAFTDKTDTNATHFKCDQCSKGFGTKSDLEKHIQTHELLENCKRQGARKDFTCNNCNCLFESKLLLLEHAKSRHAGEYFACSECEYTTGYKGNLKRHLRTHTGEKPYQCTQCDYTSAWRKALQRHLRTHTGEKPYRCTQCDYTSAWREALQRHLRTHTGEKPYRCTQCDYTSAWRKALQRHLRTHTGEKPYRCTQCDYTSAWREALQTHLRRHTGEKPYRCTQCDYTSAWRKALQRHLRTHTGEKPYRCTQCDYTSARREYLKTHLRTHTGEKPYRCTQCDSAFACSSNLQKHRRTHTGEKPYRCTQCDSAFPCSGDLHKHRRTHTGEKPYRCTQCDSAFACSGDLHKHRRTHTGKKPYECNICEYKTTQSSSLKSHLMSRHSGQKPYACGTCSYKAATKGNLSRHMKRCHKQA